MESSDTLIKNETATPSQAQASPAPVGLKKLLNITGVTKKIETGPVETINTTKPVFEYLSQARKLTEIVINEELAPLKDPTATGKILASAITTLAALSPKNSEVTLSKQEIDNQVQTLINLRSKIVEQIQSRFLTSFERSTALGNSTLIENITPFQKSAEITQRAFAIRENYSPTTGKLKRATHVAITGKQTPLEIIEFYNTLATLCIGSIKSTLPEISLEESKELQKAKILLQNLKANRPNLPKETIERAELVNTKTQEVALANLVGSILMRLQPDEKSVAQIEREIELFESKLEEIGTEIETIDAIHKDEFTTVKALEVLYDSLDTVKIPEHYKKPETPEEIRLQIFQGIREIDPAMGKATTLVLTEKLANDEEWLPNFLENGKDAIYQAKGYRNLIVLSEPENSLFGKLNDPENYVEEGETLNDAINLVNRAENIIYSEPVLSTLINNSRESIIYAAKKVFETDITEEELKKRPLLNTLKTMKENAELMIKTISHESIGAGKNTDLADVLEEQERQGRVKLAFVQITKLLSMPEISRAIDTIIGEENNSLNTLKENEAPDENDLKAIKHCYEKLATLQALKDVSDQENLSEETYKHTLSVLGLILPKNDYSKHKSSNYKSIEVPKNMREHALIALCDNKSQEGFIIKTKELLDRIQSLIPTTKKLVRTQIEGTDQYQETEKTTPTVPFIAKRITGDLRTLREWKARNNQNRVIHPFDTALLITRSPESLKTTNFNDLKIALKTTLSANPWKDPFSIDYGETTACQASYLLIKNDKDIKDPDLKTSILALHKRVNEIQQEASKEIWGSNTPKLDNKEMLKVMLTLRAELIAKDLRNPEEGNLKSLEDKVLNLTLKSKFPEIGFDYLSAFYNSIGNEHTLQRESIKERGEYYAIKEKIPYVVAKIRTKKENLDDILRYFKSVVSSPEAMASAYILHKTQEKRTDKKEPFETRLNKETAKLEKKIEAAKEELERMKKFTLDEEESPRQHEHNIRIRAAERGMIELYMKHEKLQELKKTTHALNQINDTGSKIEIEAALHQNTSSNEALTSLSDAFDKALAKKALELASSATKLDLPRVTHKSITPLQIIEAAKIQEEIEAARRYEKAAINIIRLQKPAAKDIDVEEGNPQDIAKTLKLLALEIYQESEMNHWQRGASLDLTSQRMFIEENPEILEKRKEWLDTLKKTENGIKPTALFADTQDQKKKKKNKSAIQIIEKEEIVR